MEEEEYLKDKEEEEDKDESIATPLGGTFTLLPLTMVLLRSHSLSSHLKRVQKMYWNTSIDIFSYNKGEVNIDKVTILQPYWL